MQIAPEFKLTKPCANCPFRSDDKAISLAQGRREDIIEGLLLGREPTFHCHKTVYRSDGRNHDDSGEFRPVDVCHCPGAAAVTRKFGRDTVVVQIASRMGLIPAEHYEEALAGTIAPEDLRIDRQKVHC